MEFIVSILQTENRLRKWCTFFTKVILSSFLVVTSHWRYKNIRTFPLRQVNYLEYIFRIWKLYSRRQRNCRTFVMIVSTICYRIFQKKICLWSFIATIPNHLNAADDPDNKAMPNRHQINYASPIMLIVLNALGVPKGIRQNFRRLPPCLLFLKNL